MDCIVQEQQTDEVVVLDFETSGISPDQGHRVIEVGAVRLRDGRFVSRFQQLINPGFRVSSFIESYTGITNGMLCRAPAAGEVMESFYRFIGTTPLVAHNASFDRRFLDSELAYIGFRRRQPFGCSMLAARRIYPDAPNHRLETLIRYKALPIDGAFHRALADATMAARLWQAMNEELIRRYGFRQVSFELMSRVSSMPRERASTVLLQLAAQSTAAS